VSLTDEDSFTDLRRAAGDEASGSWPQFLRTFRSSDAMASGAWAEMFSPLRHGATDDLVVLGQIGQSLDGRIATETGHSKYINGPAGLQHLHRLRALVDAVVVGVGTALTDDPQLTVRRVPGPNPARVVLDPKGRLPSQARMFAADGARRIVVTAATTLRDWPSGVEVLRLPILANGRFTAQAILAALAGTGLRRVLIEGGADTVSRFLSANCLDRLHIVFAPIILGAGPAGIGLPPIERADQALRVPLRMFQLDDEMLLDCDLSEKRVPLFGCAKTSR
jgi:riboflavin-specific deaminase-like protein